MLIFTGKLIKIGFPRKMKRITFVVAALFAANMVSAQYSFRAIIKTREGNEALAGTTLFINGLNKSAIADSNGLVIVKDITVGNYFFVFTHVGFKTKKIEFSTSLFSNEPITITLENGAGRVGRAGSSNNQIRSQSQ